MIRKRKSRGPNAINASSMADIAFLLLIFFLVTTTINVDKGIFIILPPWSEEEPEIAKINDRNTFVILLNSHDQLLVKGELMKVERLRENVIEFLENPYRKKTLSESPLKAVVSFKNDRATSYSAYIEVWNELKGAYIDLWNQESRRLYGVDYADLKGNKKEDKEKQKTIRKLYPMRISEAEPDNVTKAQ